jgi:spore coat polysaccharide biosynthesis protein SpsF
MKTVAIVQARMTSTRLPGKVLLDLGGRPMLARQLDRLKLCEMLDEIVVATTTNRTDDPVIDLCRQERVRFFRGSEHDVLGRYVAAARDVGAEVVVRVTADCPLIDPEITDLVVSELVNNSATCDYVSNSTKQTFPRGLDAEAFFLDTLLRMDRLATSDAAREHVTLFLTYERPELFLCRDIVDSADHSDLRWTVDTATDMELVRTIFDDLGMSSRTVLYREILDHVLAHPQLASMNAHTHTWDPLHPPRSS